MKNILYMIFALGVIVSCSKKDEINPTTNTTNTNNPKIFSYNHIDLSGTYKLDTNTIYITKLKVSDTITYTIQGIFSNYDTRDIKRTWKENFTITNNIATTSYLTVVNKTDGCFAMRFDARESREYCDNKLEISGNNLIWKAVITGNGGPTTKLLIKK